VLEWSSSLRAAGSLSRFPGHVDAQRVALFVASPMGVKNMAVLASDVLHPVRGSIDR